MTDRVYCHGDLVATRIVDDWYVCGGCGHDLWPVDATFAVDPDGLSSEHGYQDEAPENKRGNKNKQGEEADADPRGAASPGRL